MTATALPTYDPARLAEALRERGLPGRRSKTAILNLRRERNRRRPAAPTLQLTLADRLNRWLLATYTAEIHRRGGQTTIDSGDREVALSIADRADGLTLLTAHGWRKYGREGYRQVRLTYLCGKEDGQVWAVRVAGTIETVRAALNWITPRAVTVAQTWGKRVHRQGDVYAVETTARYDSAGAGELPDNHVWEPATRTLSHPQHGTLHLPYPVRFCRQRTYAMGRSGARGYGD